MTILQTRPEEQGMLTGLVGRGIMASRSPLLHQAEADAQGLRLLYALHDFDRAGWDDAMLPRLLAALHLAGCRGINVTFPFKQAIVPLLDGLSPEAEAIGAVNTVVFAGGRALGHNTDVIGFAQGLRDHVPARRLDRVVLLGAGGAGSAAAHALLDMGVGLLTIVEPDEGRLAALADALARRFGRERIEGRASAGEALAQASGLVNTTPIGMAKLPGVPVDTALLAHRPWVYDVIYVPVETQLLREARAMGCLTIGGVTMVIHQAAAAFRLMTGLEADPDRMRSTFG